MIVASLDPGLTTIVGVVFSGGIVYAWVAYKKVGPETEALRNESLIEINEEYRAEFARQKALIQSLREQNDRQEQVILEQEKALTRAEGRIRALTQELNDLEDSRDERGN